MRRFTTVDLGSYSLGEHARFEVRLLHDSDSAFYLLFNGVTLDGPHASAEVAKARAAAGAPNVVWRGSAAPREDEAPCPICAAPVRKWPRYPRLICGACVCEAVDGRGRAVKFSNTELLGHGIAAWLPDGTHPEEPHICFIRGVRCHASEGYFGGIVVEVEGRPAK